MNNTISMPQKRLLAVDILRGLTVMLMIMVNNGAGEEIFATLKHSKWNGMTPCDLVFPFFLFIMGFSIFLSLKKSEFLWSAPTARRIVKRTVLLFTIGLCINWFDMACSGRAFDLQHLRVWGVMQRLAICYFAVSLMAISIPKKLFKHIAIGLLFIYAFILIVGNGYSEDASLNWLSQADKWLVGKNHLYTKSAVDPEGLVSTISAIAHTMIGFLFGKTVISSIKLANNADKALWLLATGASIGATGWLLAFGMPLNKRIWSPSYVLTTCGMAAMALGLIIRFADMEDTDKNAETKHIKASTTLAKAFGTNPLFLYVASEIIAIVFGACGIKDGTYHVFLAIIGNGYWASVAYSIAFVALHAIIAMSLWTKRIFIKI